MKNHLIIGLISILTFSCFPTKNEFGLVRFKPSRFKIKPSTNPDFINIIDTASFYITLHSKAFIEEYNLENYITGYKFYGNGRVGLFKGVDFTKPETFNPKKAFMCYYNYSEDGFFIESLYPTPGGKHYLSKNKIINHRNDTLVLERINNRSLPFSITKYKRKILPKEALIYKPDW